MLAQKYRMDLTVQVKDFIRYLHVKSLSESSEELCFDDSTTRRKMRAYMVAEEGIDVAN